MEEKLKHVGEEKDFINEKPKEEVKEAPKPKKKPHPRVPLTDSGKNMHESTWKMSSRAYRLAID